MHHPHCLVCIQRFYYARLTLLTMSATVEKTITKFSNLHYPIPPFSFPFLFSLLNHVSANYKYQFLPYVFLKPGSKQTYLILKLSNPIIQFFFSFHYFIRIYFIFIYIYIFFFLGIRQNY